MDRFHHPSQHKGKKKKAFFYAIEGIDRYYSYFAVEKKRGAPLNLLKKERRIRSSAAAIYRGKKGKGGTMSYLQGDSPLSFPQSREERRGGGGGGGGGGKGSML